VRSPFAQEGAQLAELAGEIRRSAWDLAVEVVEEGLRDSLVPSLERLDSLTRLDDIPSFVGALGREIGQSEESGFRHGGPLATLAREHAREREALGFAPREVVTEFLLLRRVLRRFVAPRRVLLDTAGAQTLERRLDETIDRLVVECVGAYFDRATTELADRARRDGLTGLLNHQAFSEELELELERARRYRRDLSVVFSDVDRFKQINDTLGHLEGDRVLERIAASLREITRGSDFAGRLGGDEFAVCLVETDLESGHAFVRRFERHVAELSETEDLPRGVSISAGVAQFPVDGSTVVELLRRADTRLYDEKRSRHDDSK
jgi:diguanylate cyclase (GGDEF)-like protein